jgi:hypothetical protein
MQLPPKLVSVGKANIAGSPNDMFVIVTANVVD